jgi:glycosyltransferase involved in cell wall biosynthesis
MKAKVILLVEDLNTGGLERVIQVLAATLDSVRYDTEVWCLSKGGAIADELRERGATVRILGLRSYFNPLSIMKLASRLRAAGPAILHTHGYFAGTFGRIAGLLARVPAMFHHVHSTYWGFTKRNLLVERLLSGATEKIICCSGAVAGFVTGTERISPEKTAVVYNGIVPPSDETGKNTPLLRKELNLRDGETVLGIAASLTPNKGHTCLLRAEKEISAVFPSSKVLIIGDGDCRQKLEQEAAALGIASRVIFTGRRSDIFDLLSVIDIAVLPTLEREGLGVFLIEAMAMAKPVVASRIGGIPEVVSDGVNGVLVGPGDSAGLAAALIGLIKDPERRRAMGGEGRKIFNARFTARHMTGAVENLYRDALAGRRA